MFNNVALDVSIGLVFVFLTYSLLATTVQEMIARFLTLRSRMLTKGIRTMLEDRHEDYKGNFVWVYIQRVWTTVTKNIRHFRCPHPDESLSKKFYEHPVIKYLSESSWHSKPSYIGADNFSTTIIKMLRGAKYDGTQSQMDAIKKTIGEWESKLEEEISKAIVMLLIPVKGKIDQGTIDKIKQLRNIINDENNPALKDAIMKIDSMLDALNSATKVNDDILKSLEDISLSVPSRKLSDSAKTKVLAVLETTETKIMKKIGTIMVTIDDEVVKVGVETLQHVQQLIVDAQNDIQRFKALLEKWFDNMMERVNGWYKKQTQFILLIIGFVFAASFNVDTIAIYHVLAKDKKARDGMVQMAIANKPQYGAMVDSLTRLHKRDTVKTVVQGSDKKDSTILTVKDSVYVNATNQYLDTTYKMLVQDAQEADQIMGLGKPYSDSLKKYCALRYHVLDSLLKTKKDTLANDNVVMHWFYKYNHKEKIKEVSGDPLYHRYDSITQYYCHHTSNLVYNSKQTSYWSTFFGWLITALAVSLGAPFWFDMLNKLIEMRSSGKKPDNDKKDSSNKTGNTDPTPVQKVG